MPRCTTLRVALTMAAVAMLLVSVQAQQAQTRAEVVPPADTLLRLKNGGEVRGKLVEIKNGAYVLIVADGRTVLYPTSDVDVAEHITAPTNPPAAKGAALLAPGRRAYVRPVPEKDTHEVVGNLLRGWGRWVVVETREEADIQVRPVLTGSNGWGKASIIASIEEVSTSTELWKSQKETGYRTIFHGYAAPFNRAAEGILKQMQKASATWPKE